MIDLTSRSYTLTWPMVTMLFLNNNDDDDDDIENKYVCSSV